MSPLYYAQDTITEWFSNRQEICYFEKTDKKSASADLHLESAGSNPAGDRLLFASYIEALISRPKKTNYGEAHWHLADTIPCLSPFVSYCHLRLYDPLSNKIRSCRKLTALNGSTPLLSLVLSLPTVHSNTQASVKGAL